MKCIDCKEKQVENPNDAEIYLINEYSSVRPLCKSCYNDYAHELGSVNLDEYFVEITGTGQEKFIKGINDVLGYLNDMNRRYRDRYFAAKKLGENAKEIGIEISPESLLEILKW